MKKISIKGLAVLTVSLGLFFTSCKRFSGDFADTNVNPGVTGSPIYGALMTNVQANVAGFASQTRGGLYSQYFSETQYTDVSLYSLPQINFEGNYSGILNDLQNIINTGPNDNMKAVARILKAYLFSTLTDSWGDLPYSQALTGNPTPAFDKQADIYSGMISELAAAVNQLGGSAVVAGDIIYAGNITKWKKLANSLRMRLAIQLSKKYPAAGGYSAVQFNAALTHPDGFITDNADNFKVVHPGGNFKSPWYNLYDGRKDFGQSEPMALLMTSLGDGRQAAYGSSTQGVPYGRLRSYIDPWTSANPNWSRILSDANRAENGVVVALPASETFLHRAEAADRGWTGESMTALYQQGINASFAQWGIAAPAAGYFTQSGVVLSQPAGTAANMQRIAIQQYIAGYPDGLRGWNIWRRTGWPVLTPAPDATNTSHLIPRRYTYGQTSYGSNTAAVTAAVAALPGGDTQDSKVWWDQ
jgi:Starch-binding associating with outer membrane